MTTRRGARIASACVMLALAGSVPRPASAEPAAARGSDAKAAAPGGAKEPAAHADAKAPGSAKQAAPSADAKDAAPGSAKQAAPSADAKEAARAEYARGVEAYRQGKYVDAVELFLKADQLSPSAPLSFNIARAYERLGDDAAALRWYRDYLRRDPEAKNAAVVRERTRALAGALEKKGVQQLTVLTTPPGATVTIDERPAGVTPLTLELAPGSHQLLVTRRGFADERREFALEPSSPLDIDLALREAKPTADPSARRAGSSTAGKRPFGVLPWVVLGAGGAALGGALGFEVARRSAESSAEDPASQREFRDDYERMESRQQTARILAGVGSALVAGGVVLLVLNREREDGVQVSVRCGAFGSCGAAAHGRF